VSTQQLTAEAVALALPDRVSLAQALWESIEAALAETDEDSAVREAIRRDDELSLGAATGRTHEEVMQLHNFAYSSSKSQLISSR
jgi:hypothetical protein